MKNIKGLRVLTDCDPAKLSRMRIGEAWESGTSGEVLEVVSPATGEVVGYVPMGTREDARRAIAAAQAAKQRIAGLSVWERARLCMKVAEAIEARGEELARALCLEQGKPYHAEALGEVAAAAAGFRNAGEQIKWLETACFPVEDRNKRAFSFLQPKGVFAVITPWNFPLCLPAIYYLGPGLATGNAMVWVPAPTTSIIAGKLMQCLQAAGVPDGVVNLVTGDGPVVGDEVVAHPGTDAIAFTGSSATGRSIAGRGAGKPLMLELGGNGPTIVLADADLPVAAERIAAGCFTNAGQICTSTERILAHASVYDELVALLVAAAGKVRMGDAFDPSVTMGPLNNEPNARKVDEHLADAVRRGARVMVGGGRAEHLATRLHYQPTVIAGVPEEALLNIEETFGPVAPVLRFEDEDEARRIVGRSRFGLSAAVFTSSIRHGMRWAEWLKVGIVNINEMCPYWEMHIPAGGAAGTSSGVGRTGGRHTLLEMSDLKTVTIDISR
jgi:succinate-semialdehyde dehydrogenase/glutarate-semialdehyde dehydrogenase